MRVTRLRQLRGLRRWRWAQAAAAILAGATLSTILAAPNEVPTGYDLVIKRANGDIDVVNTKSPLSAEKGSGDWLIAYTEGCFDPKYVPEVPDGKDGCIDVMLIPFNPGDRFLGTDKAGGPLRRGNPDAVTAAGGNDSD